MQIIDRVTVGIPGETGDVTPAAQAAKAAAESARDTAQQQASIASQKASQASSAVSQAQQHANRAQQQADRAEQAAASVPSSQNFANKANLVGGKVPDSELGASSSVVADTVAKRYTAGRLRVGAPSEGTDAANKQYVDNRVSGLATVSQLTGLGTPSAVANQVAKRDGSGRLQVSSPSGSSDAANKGYVDGRVPVAASASEVLAGVVSNKFVTPAGLHSLGFHTLATPLQYMTNTQTANLSKNINTLQYGIWVIFRGFAGTAQNWGWTSFFVPKYIVTQYPGHTHSFALATGSGHGLKELIIYNDRIVGHSNNNITPTGSTVSGTSWVLAYVLGI